MCIYVHTHIQLYTYTEYMIPKLLSESGTIMCQILEAPTVRKPRPSDVVGDHISGHRVTCHALEDLPSQLPLPGIRVSHDIPWKAT